MRKTAFIGFVIVVLLVGVGIFAYLFGYTDVFITKQTSNNQPPTPTLPQQQSPSGLVALTTRAIVSPVLSFDQRSVWYFDESGKLYKYSLDGKNEQEFALPDPRPVKAVMWQPKGSDLIERVAGSASVSVADGGPDRFRLYQAQSKAFVDYPVNFQSVAWLADGKRIVYVWKSGDGSLALKTSNADGSNFATVVPLTAAYEIESSPTGNVVVLYQPAVASATAVAKALRVDVDAKTVTELLDRGKNVEVKFSPDVNKLLFNRVNEQTSKPELWVHDFVQRTYANLKITTSISKIAWHNSSSRFYYALPESITAGDTRVQQKTKDTIFVYTLNTAASSKLPGQENAPQVDIRDMVAADSDTMLVFRNGIDNKLYVFKQAAPATTSPAAPAASSEPYD